MTGVNTAYAAPLRNRVPEVTVDFWLIKLMAVTVGETAAACIASLVTYATLGRQPQP